MRVVAVNISEKKGVSKRPVPEGEFRIGVGLAGDAHAGPGIRQVSLLAKEDYSLLKAGTPEECKQAGIFAENLTTEGIELFTLPLGTLLKIGAEVVLEVSKIGKECHAGCAIRQKVGDCVMPRRGIFGIVKKEGIIRPGDEIAFIKQDHL